jgi:hypothetical protein
MIHDPSQTERQNMGSRNDPGDLSRKEVPDIVEIQSIQGKHPDFQRVLLGAQVDASFIPRYHPRKRLRSHLLEFTNQLKVYRTAQNPIDLPNQVEAIGILLFPPVKGHPHPILVVQAQQIGGLWIDIPANQGPSTAVQNTAVPAPLAKKVSHPVA